MRCTVKYGTKLKLRRDHGRSKNTKKSKSATNYTKLSKKEPTQTDKP
jgi:hypothetical protein